MILINRVVDENNEDSFKLMEIDEYSFVEPVPDGKYFSNKLLICGKF